MGDGCGSQALGLSVASPRKKKPVAGQPLGVKLENSSLPAIVANLASCHAEGKVSSTLFSFFFTRSPMGLFPALFHPSNRIITNVTVGQGEREDTNSTG